MNPDKKKQRAQLISARLNLTDRYERSQRLQSVLRAFLIGRQDLVIGAYWPIKAEFDALPALYRWQEDALLGAGLAANGAASTPPDPLLPRYLDEKTPDAGVSITKSATEFIAKLVSDAQGMDSHAQLPAGPSRSPRKIGLPVIDREHKTLQFHAWWPGCPMEPDAYDIPKPKDTEVVVPSLLLVPCLGYSDGGFRLGYGGGFYDRTLASLSPRPFTVGLGFANGYVPGFEPEAHDVPLDAILSDHGQMWPKGD
jgi:5-formyltetrahydrofolate cyclo-ligase